MQKLILLVALLIVQFAFSQETKKEKPEELETVVIESETKAITNKNGNLKVDVANSIYSSQPNTIELLSKLPKIQISPDKESISIIGKGRPLLYIDNQKVSLNDLNTLDVADIKTIEIINNPSAKYEADGRAVILITRKFSKKEGYKVSVSENAIFKKYFNNYAGINSSFKTGKFEFKANFSYNQIKVWEKNGNNFVIPDYDIKSNYLVTAVTDRPQFLYGGGIFYKITEDDYFSANLSARSQKDNFDIVTKTHNEDGTDVNDINTLNRNGESRNFISGFLNYNHKIKSINTVLFSGFQYSNYNQQIASVISNDYNETGSVLSQFRDQDFGVNVFSGRIDLEKKFKNEMKLEVGALYLEANARTDFKVENFNPPTSTNSNYTYKEQNLAAYSQFSGTYNKLNYSAGLRAENTIVKGKYDSESTLSIDKNYINLFPKAQLELVIDSSNIISVNYAKSIMRPNFSSTSQVSVYINPYFVWSNNINLDPTISNELSLTYQHKELSLRLIRYKSTNPVYSGASYDDSQNLLTFNTTNFDKQSDMAIELTVPFKYKFWSTTNVLNIGQTKIEDKSAVVNTSKPSVYFYSNHIFKLKKELEFSVTGWGYTTQKLGIFERSGLFTFDAAVSKTFFKQLSCSIGWNDIFRKIKYKETFIINTISSRGIYYSDSRSIAFSVKYTFGKIKSVFIEKSVDENSGRIK
ncbi:outer membrane beta-barrel family protein [Flavobacterium sp.]|uniref:outer membrane beta-barrel family protein n=1 Tax=Flavobacterium sp. TaxID=239 RepID=UPI0024883B11|nr:outer membrane beta-barrel family protein [Flavobacterium sp.]MDI1315999.1 outer membrane beta-barrel family protein [Flavobacterium sp.]